MDCLSHMLKDFTPPEPLSGENEDKLCMIGLWLNFKHTEAQSRETAANAAMNEAGDTADQAEQFERLKAVVDPGSRIHNLASVGRAISQQRSSRGAI